MAEDLTLQSENTQSYFQLIQSHSPELRIAILGHIPNQQTLRNVVLSGSTFSSVYYGHQRHILLELTRNAFEADMVNIAIPLLACRAQQVDVLASDHLEVVTALLKTISEHKAIPKQTFLQISVEECKQMLRLRDAASQICNDWDLKGPSFGLLKRDEMSQKPLSTAERCRISTAIYRWELWAGLFSQRTRNVIQMQEPVAQIDIRTQKAVYLARYTRWEQEQLGCIYNHVHKRLKRLSWESRKHFSQNRGAGPSHLVEKDCEPAYMLNADADASREANHCIIGRGPQLFAGLLRKSDLKWRRDTMVACIYNFDPSIRSIIGPRSVQEPPNPAATDEDIGTAEEDQPYGYRWALADNPVSPERPSLLGAWAYLWRWEYAFWDEGRLRNWGVEMFIYKDDQSGGIYDRASGRQLQGNRCDEF